jgi:hypothetical protein
LKAIARVSGTEATIPEGHDNGSFTVLHPGNDTWYRCHVLKPDRARMELHVTPDMALRVALVLHGKGSPDDNVPSAWLAGTEPDVLDLQRHIGNGRFLYHWAKGIILDIDTASFTDAELEPLVRKDYGSLEALRSSFGATSPLVLLEAIALDADTRGRALVIDGLYVIRGTRASRTMTEN